ncbi:MAG: contractile injection system tape measure protein [Bacteroidia bacterium]
MHHPPSSMSILAQALVDAIETQPRPKPKPAAKSEPDKSLWIDNAGLILFSPFLQRYLQYAGLVEDKSWVSVEARHHGVRLLQMMVDPSGEWNEASLALPKLLCGLQPDSIVDPYIPLPEDLRGQDAALIEVALSHWTAAGKIGIEGFRAAWLARNASLRIRDDHWLLRVEAMGADMLLELLPWDIAYISLPWMSAVIYVDWGEKAKFNAI